MENVVLILGYNNTRIKDVEKIILRVEEHLSARAVLCKESLTPEDMSVCDGGIAVDLEGGEDAAAMLLDQCEHLGWRVIAVLPFSDKGTQLGAHLAEKLMLNGPDPETVAAALDKYQFRQYEAAAEMLPMGYQKVRAEQITTWDELQKIYQEWGGKLFIKPMREGNSRGCKIVDSPHACVAAWEELAPYHENGIMVEELIEDAQEYSWDAVGGRVWITEKQTTTSHYRAEIQQIVPAPLTVEKYNKLVGAGFFMAELAGFRGGACHNEIFYQSSNHSVIAVEPNLRPAGMHIWDLAALAYTNFDPWKEWILWAAGGLKLPLEPLHFNVYAGIRMIQATHAGKIVKIDPIDIKTLASDAVELLECRWTRAKGEQVDDQVKDNSGFLGFIIARSKRYEKLVDFLETTTLKLAKQVVIA